MDLHQRFEQHEEESHCFERVRIQKTARKDLHAMLLLDTLFPGTQDMVSGAAHDQIWFCIESEQLEKLTDDQIIELRRCGIWHDDEHDCLTMFV